MNTFASTSNNICGVCELSGGDQFWPNHKSKYAHKACVNQINSAQQNIIRDILELFHDDPVVEKHSAFIRAVKAVRLTCQTTLLEYLNKHGMEKLKNLFDTVGAKAIMRKSKY